MTIHRKHFPAGVFIWGIFLCCCCFYSRGMKTPSRYGLLSPTKSEFREILSLDGLWNFRLAPRAFPDLGFSQKWYQQSLSLTGNVDLMPVPGNYEDIQKRSDYDSLLPEYYHIGWAWYDRHFFLPASWNQVKGDRRIFLRIGAAHYYTAAFLNGKRVLTHEGGSLPIVMEISPSLLIDGENLITVAVNNTLSHETLPQGLTSFSKSSRDPAGTLKMNTDPEFLRYGGIHGSVMLYTTPQTFIDQITISTWSQETTGHLSYSIKIQKEGYDDVEASSVDGENNNLRNRESEQIVKIQLEDSHRNIVAQSSGNSGLLRIPQVNLWWPIGMVPDDQVAYMYTLQVTLMDSRGLVPQDRYKIKVGIRTVTWTHNEFFINGRPFYFKGCGRYENEDVHTIGSWNPVLMAKDVQAVRLMRCNVYRLSHHPHDEQLLEMADQMGIVVIQHVPASYFVEFNPSTRAKHKRQIEVLVRRDNNHPSVVMWAVAYAAKFTCDLPGAEEYFRDIISFTKGLDSTRAVTVVSDCLSSSCSKDGDVLALYCYAVLSGDEPIEEVRGEFSKTVGKALERYEKPLLLAEYGFHLWELSAEQDCSERNAFHFNLRTMPAFWESVDKLRSKSSCDSVGSRDNNKGGIIGELIWNREPFFMRMDPLVVLDGSRGINAHHPVLTVLAQALRGRNIEKESTKL